MNKHFKWHPDAPPPAIEAHSKAKLNVLRRYLRAYFDTLNVNPKSDVFKLDLIDGFSGGGTFLDEGKVLSGTPLIMLEETAAATERLNRIRTKPLFVDCKTYFIDKEQAHVDHLRRVLLERNYALDDARLIVQTGRFENHLASILDSIRQRQPRSGRAIFLLDQTGFSQVELAHVRRILAELPAAEVILTFSTDNLVNHLVETPGILKAVTPIGLTVSQVRDLIRHRGDAGGRAIIQRTLRDHVRTVTGAAYDTPFFIRPRLSRRALWFLHLSRHPTARDVMIRQHWEIRNTFEHYGTGGIGMLGWDPIIESDTVPLFQFSALDEQQMRDQLLDSLPRKLFAMVAKEPMLVDSVRHMFANETAARFIDLDRVILKLFQEREFEIVGPDGRVRSRQLKRLRSTDRVALPAEQWLPGLSFRYGNRS